MADCIFCKIVSGDIPSTRVYEDENVVAFLDINPNNFGHTLVLPRSHVENVFDAPTETLLPVYAAAQKIARALKATGAEGINLISNNGGAAGQVVFHAHLHVIPRYENDGLKHWSQKKYESDEQMRDVAESIKKAI